MLFAGARAQPLLCDAPLRLQPVVSLLEFRPAYSPTSRSRRQQQRPWGRPPRPAAQFHLAAAAAAAWPDADADGAQQAPLPQPPASLAQQVQRALGLDYGRRVVGLAVSTLGLAPRPLDGLPGCAVHEQMALAATVLDVARREGCDAVVVGLPVTERGSLRQRDTDSQQGRRCRNFAHNLAAAAAQASGGGSLRVFLADERGSTMQARQELAASGRRKAAASKVKDSVAAAVILASFFEDPGAALLVKPPRPRPQAGGARQADGQRPPQRRQRQPEQ